MLKKTKRVSIVQIGFLIFSLSTLFFTYSIVLPQESKSQPLFTPTSGEWTQQAHDPQHTSYTDQIVSTPWKWNWSWNGPDANGKPVAGKFLLPRNVEPVTGGKYVYIAAGKNGVFALQKSTGEEAWNNLSVGTINSTVGYDPDTRSVFVVSTDGSLYKLDAETGSVVTRFATKAESQLPLPPVILEDRVVFSMGSLVYAVSKDQMSLIWSFDLGTAAHTPPAYSASRNSVIVVGQDLFVQAVDNANGKLLWKTKPISRSPGDPGQKDNTLAEAFNGWPVVADNEGMVLVRYRIDYASALNEYGYAVKPFPPSNAELRTIMTQKPYEQNLFALSLDTGKVPFISNVGSGGWGERPDFATIYMPSMPVIKTLADGKQVVWIPIRGGSTSQADRWDAHLGEMVLDDTTVKGMSAGEVRWMSNEGSPFPADELPYLTGAGDMLFGGHWMMGFARLITNRSDSVGSFTNPIQTTVLPQFISSASNLAFSRSHFSSGELINDGDDRMIPQGFYVYYGVTRLYERYFIDYARWIVSDGALYYRTVDGAIISLGHNG